MNKRRIASYICFFLAFVLLVLAAAAPIYREGVPDYDEKYDVIEGSGGFLFRARGASSDELGDFSGKNLYTEDALSRTVTALTSIAGKLRDGGCGVLFVFVPSKMTVYRDRLPGNVARLYSAERKYTELLSALEGAGERTLDLTETFSRIKDGEQIYHTASDDLNDPGGFRLAEASLSALGLGAPKETDYDISESSDTDYPLCREYRNETGKTAPKRSRRMRRTRNARLRIRTRRCPPEAWARSSSLIRTERPPAANSFRRRQSAPSSVKASRRMTRSRKNTRRTTPSS